jgi:hypothetical protein
MTLPQHTTTESHREMAAAHHEQAARYHRAASRHFQSGKDYAHTAHEALLAHGHSLRALDFGRRATVTSAIPSKDRINLRNHQTLSLQSKLPAAARSRLCANSAEHHCAAALHSEAAAEHEREASTHERALNLEAAAVEALLATQHGERSLFHSDEAAKQLSI